MKKYDYQCIECFKPHSRWTGMCFNCAKWNTVVLKSKETNNDPSRTKKLFIKPLDISSVAKEKLSSGINDFDNVIGGGFHPSTVAVLSGPPGVGKSSFLVNLICQFSFKNKLNAIYFSLEESLDQLSLRLFQRNKLDYVHVSDVRELDDIKKSIIQSDSKFVIIDSIQLVTEQKNNNFGQSSSTVKSVINDLVEFTKKNSIVLIFISQVVKSGKLAGPKYLEHMVDIVLEMSRDKEISHHVEVRSHKNRFGSCDNLASFEFINGIFHSVAVKHFNFNRDKITGPGVTDGFCASECAVYFFRVHTLIKRNSNGSSKIISDYFKKNKIEKICAIIEKVFSIKLSDFDFVISSVGGVPAKIDRCEIVIASSILSAYYQKTVCDCYLYGDISLNGDVNPEQLSDQVVSHLSCKMNLSIFANVNNLLDNIHKIDTLKDLTRLYK